MDKRSIKEIRCEKAPLAIGPYSQAVMADPFVFVAGQLPLDPSTGEIISGDIRLQTEQVITNLENILSEAGLCLGDVVKSEVFLTDMGDFAAVNEVYSSKFKVGVKPARSVTQAAALPKGAKIEISCIAYRELDKEDKA